MIPEDGGMLRNNVLDTEVGCRARGVGARAQIRAGGRRAGRSLWRFSSDYFAVLVKKGVTRVRRARACEEQGQSCPSRGRV